jgi:zinc protease
LSARQFVSILLAVPLLAAQPVPTSSPLPLPSSAPQPSGVFRTTLANGMRVVLLPNHLAPVATTVVEYGVGSNEDTIPGIAHATEHMMFRGTSDVSAAQFADIAARAGADYDAQTSSIDTVYYFTLPSPYVDVALRLEADRMANATLAQSAWEAERGAIEQEVRAHESTPTASLMPQIRKALYGDTPYANDPVGTIAGFDRMTAADIARFYHAWYHPNNATLVVGGDVEPAAVMATIHQLFDPIPSQTLPKAAPITTPALSATTIDGGVAELPVPIVAFDYRFPPLGDPHYAAGLVLMQALDDQRSALHDLVVSGKVLAAFGFAGGVREIGDGGLFAVGLPAQAPASLEAALQSVLDEYRQSGIPDNLVAAAKAQLLSKQLYREDSIPGLTFSWSSALGQGYDSPDDIYTAIAAVTARDVNAILNRYMDKSLRATIVMRPKATSTIPQATAATGTDNVSFPVDVEQALPPWAASYFLAALRPPSENGTTVMRLKNGITLAVRRETFAPVVELEGGIRNNTDLNEPAGKDGVADVVDTLLGWGTTTYDRDAYQAQLDAISASVGLGLGFSLKVPSANFDRGVALLADGMLHPAFPATAFTLVKDNSAKTLAASANEPDTLADLARLYALYPPGDPHRRHETAASISRIDLSDVRNWYRLAFRPQLTTIAIVGDVSPTQARDVVEKYFGSWHVSGRFPNFDYPAVRWSSGHKASTVTVTSTVARSTFTIDFASDPRNVGKAQAAALGVIERMRAQALPPQELQRAKALLLAQRVLPMDSYDGLASYLYDDAANGWTGADEHDYWVRMLAVTPAELRNAMRRYVNVRHFSRVIVAPKSP